MVVLSDIPVTKKIYGLLGLMFLLVISASVGLIVVLVDTNAKYSNLANEETVSLTEQMRFRGDSQNFARQMNNVLLANSVDVLPPLEDSLSRIMAGIQRSMALAKQASSKSHSLEETAAALDQITATVHRSATGTTAAQAVVASAKSRTDLGEAVVKDAVAAMTEIERSSQEIGQIIGVVDEIAFQTNLLALNAGVEAARAGDASRGFAVVASEVRALAQRSADAAKEIKGLIGASTSQVSCGVILAKETGNALSQICDQVTQINAAVSEIVASAQEQASGLAQVNTAINQMDQVTQRNAAMVEEATGASHAEVQETAELERLTARFRTGVDQPAERIQSRDPGADKASRVPSPAKPLRIVAGNTVRKPRPEQDAWREF